MFVRHLHTQKTVLGKNDRDGYECKSESSFANLTVLSVRFLFMSKVHSFLSFDGRCFVFVTLARLGMLLVGKSGSVVLPNVFAFSFHQDGKNCLVQFLNEVKSNRLIFAN